MTAMVRLIISELVSWRPTANPCKLYILTMEEEEIGQANDNEASDDQILGKEFRDKVSGNNVE